MTLASSATEQENIFASDCTLLMFEPSINVLIQNGPSTDTSDLYDPSFDLFKLETGDQKGESAT